MDSAASTAANSAANSAANTADSAAAPAAAPPGPGDGVFALLDDAGASAAQPSSRLYTGFVRQHVCTEGQALQATCAALAADQQAGLHALLLADYEWGAALIAARHRPPTSGSAPGHPPALRLLMFRHLARLSADEVAAWLQAQDDGAPAGAMGLQPSVDEGQFHAAIARIHQAIADGETYQVNYTYRLSGAAYGAPTALYRRLRERQRVPYGALIRLPEEPGNPVRWVLSRSPELFVQHQAGLLTARPMKGTARRIGGQPEGDSETARGLAQDIKNRAENLMIVDLLRNDLGRVAQTGSVQVPTLFQVEPYATVFQMTSTVQARLASGVALPGLLRAVFPCGSITGAPKHHTMGLITDLETTPRGLYCGAIGWLDAPAPGQALGDCCLSVAIRTLTLGPERQGLRPLTLGIGAGIVQDSVAADEAEECRLKARFLTGLNPGFGLFETMLASRSQGVPLLDPHLARLAHSAALLGFAFDRAAALQVIRQALQALPSEGPYRLRLDLAHDGRIHTRAAALPALPAGPVRLRIAPQRLASARPLAQHKTTARALYDAGVLAAEAEGAFDSLFFNEQGHLVEGGRCNVWMQLQGRWYTPPLADGALPGVMRGRLLDDAAWAASERVLTLDDLRQAEALAVCNALRGVLPAHGLAPAAAAATPVAGSPKALKALKEA